MNQKELRKLNRVELQDLIQEQNAVIEKLQLRVEELQDQLADRTVKIEQAGTLADAAVQISGVLEAAQKAAEQYLENIRVMSERQQDICTKKEEESKAKCRSYEMKVKQRCAELERTTEEQVNARWNEFSMKVDQCLQAHGELKEILKISVSDPESEKN